MLVATRDPMPSPGAHDDRPRPPHMPMASRGTRFVAAMQIAGSVLAIPVGLASAYSVYRANFSVDTTCQTLRANIIAMIDKKLDATARRMLVRHDVETFERTCGGVDPDAEAAFKTLLAADRGEPVRVVAPVKHIEPPRIVPKAAKAEPAHEEHKLELRAAVPAEPVHEAAHEPAKEHAREAVKELPKAATPDVAHAPAKDLSKDAKVEPKDQAKPAVADIAPLEQHDPAADAQWVDAVRDALVAHEQAADAAPLAPAPVKAAAAAAPARGTPPRPLGEMNAMPKAAAIAPDAAPALPPPTQVGDPDRTVATATPAANPEAKSDHPVPPGSIPDQDRPTPNGWLSKVPFVGQVLAK